MTGSLRSTARNPVAIALMGLLVLVFLILGVGGGGRFPDAFRASHADAVVAAGGHATSTRDFKRIFDNQKQQLEQQSGQPVPAELLVRDGFDQQLLNQLALDEAEVEMLARAGVVPAPALVDGEIRKLPFAFDRVTGKFSERQFTQFLANQGLTPRQAQAELGDELALRHFTSAVEAGFRAPRLYAALNAIAGLENRDVSYFALDPHIVPQPPAPTDADLMAFMKEHAAQLTLPERRVITVARFSAKALEPAVAIDPAAVAKEFAFQKDSLSTPEKRTLVQIPVKTPAQGALAATRLARGEDPNLIAKGFGVEPIRYADQPQSAVADRKLASAAFALPQGQVSGPIQGDLGMAVVKVVKVTHGQAATLETARPKIEAGLRAKAAQNQAYELSQKFDDARQAGASVADAARKAGVTPITVGPVTAQGLDSDGKPTPALADKILKAAFAAAAGEETDLADAGPGEYFALRVERVIPPALPPLADKRAELAKAYATQKYLLALKAKAEDLMGQIRKGASIDQVAAQAGGKVVRQVGMQRVQAQQYKDLGRDFLQGVFAGKPGDVFAAAAPSGVFIAKLEAVRPGDVTAMARVTEAIRGRLSEDYLRDLLTSVKTAARQSVKVDVNLPLARQALGIDPAVLAKSGAKGAGKAK
ncbi:MAG: peptidyl-prolyl cis-trans isomerase [Caulobacteraceae bacterium]|nr:peptidyl-prolyl cis-trans isomerase [Caulobacteraceae bacterium]